MSDKEKGIYEKYWVKRREDPYDKHIDCTYFVLDLNHDKHARPALIAYAESCAEEYPELSKDLKILIEATE